MVGSFGHFFVVPFVGSKLQMNDLICEGPQNSSHKFTDYWGHMGKVLQEGRM